MFFRRCLNCETRLRMRILKAKLNFVAATFSLFLVVLIPPIVSRTNEALVSNPKPSPVTAKVNGPIIGILSEEYFGNYKDYKQSKSYIAASYVKWIEGSGGRVVSILLNQNEKYYRNLVKNLNGVVFPGGGQYLNSSSYADSGKIIFEIAKEINENGDYFPVWGTCLGMELMMVLESQNSILTRYSAHDQASPLEFDHKLKSLRKQGRLFQHLNKQLYHDFKKKNITINYHSWCLTRDRFQKSVLNNKYKILAVNHDRFNLEFISVLEGLKYPFYAVQLHPEKPLFEFVNKKNHRRIPHNPASIKTG